MTMNIPEPLLNGLIVVVGATTAYKIWCKYKLLQPPFPPSPRSYPLIGHLLSVPTHDEAIGFMELGKKLNSDIFHLSVFGTFIVVLNSSEDIINLFEKRSNIYSDRICPPMLGDPSLMDWAGITSQLGYNDRWRKTRRLIHPWLHKQAAVRFQSSQQLQARLLLQRLLERSSNIETSSELETEFFRTVAATITYSVYGYKVQSSNDSFTGRHKELVDNATKAALPSNFLVNLFPILLRVPEWLPGTDWKRVGREWRKQKDYAINSTFEWTKSQISMGEKEPSIIASMLIKAQELGLEKDDVDEYVKQAAATLLAGGTDTTANTLSIFVLAMLLYPESLKKAQAEIDDIVGPNRLPNMADQSKLQYVNRLIQEVLRWRPTVPAGVPHACSQDDVYRGYRIPKGAIIFGNIWAVTRNQAVYKDPDMFSPDRYLDPNVPFPPTFGFGRRLCPGLHYAEASLFIVIASLLAAFDISLAKNANGENLIPVAESMNEMVYHPKPFKFKITPRSNLHKNLICSGVQIRNVS